MQLSRIMLSTPQVFMISKATAVEALPEIGLINIKGKTSEGIFSKFKKGDREFFIKSKIPEYRRALIARKRAIRVGNILTTVSIPFFCTALKNYQKL